MRNAGIYCYDTCWKGTAVRLIFKISCMLWITKPMFGGIRRLEVKDITHVWMNIKTWCSPQSITLEVCTSFFKTRDQHTPNLAIIWNICSMWFSYKWVRSASTHISRLPAYSIDYIQRDARLKKEKKSKGCSKQFIGC